MLVYVIVGISFILVFVSLFFCFCGVWCLLWYWCFGRRREGYEFLIGLLKVINWELNGKKFEFFEVKIVNFMLIE